MKIENGLITYGSNSTPLDKIVSCGVFERKVSVPWSKPFWKKVIYFFFPVWAGSIAMKAYDIQAGYYSSIEYPFTIGALLGLLAMILWIPVLFKWIERNCVATQYGVRLSLTSGESELFWSNSKSFVFKVRDIIANAMASERKHSINYNINVEKQEINDYSTTHVTNSYTYEIKIENKEGLSDEDLKFLMNEFRRGVEPVAQQVQDTDNDDLKKLMEELRLLVNSGKPPAGAIKRVYDKLKACADGYGVYQGIVGLGGLVGQAAMIFSN